MKNLLDIFKSLFSCQKYSHLCSKKHDANLTTLEKVKYTLHHLVCFTCRRLSKQLDSINRACNALNPDEQLKGKCLSKEAKEKIQAAMEIEKNA